MRSRLGALPLLAALLLTGACAPTEDREVVADAQADPADLDAAVAALTDAGTGRFEVTLAMSHGDVVRDRGRYAVDPGAYDAVREVGSATGTARIAYRAVGGSSWVRTLPGRDASGTTTAGWPCWVDGADLAGREGFAEEPVPAGPPAVVQAALEAVGRHRTGLHTVVGSTRLPLVLDVLSGEALSASGIDATAADRVPATFTVAGGRVEGYQVRLSDLVGAVSDAGGSLPDGLAGGAAPDGAVVVRFSDLGRPVSVRPPARRRVLDLAHPRGGACAGTS